MRTRLACTALLACLIAPADARAAQGIEGIWKYNGGQVAVEARGAGTLVGTVIRPTFFSRCVHPIGERIWTAVRAQPDGSHRARHQYFESGGCTYIERGSASLRVLTAAGGTPFLRTCYAPPGRRGARPTIAPDGTSADAPDGCNDSSLLSPLPKRPPTLEQIAKLPKPRRDGCLRPRSFVIRLKQPRGDALERATVRLDGRRVAVRAGRRVTGRVDMRGLPPGRHTLRIVATTVRDRTVKGSREYRTCAPGRAARAR